MTDSPEQIAAGLLTHSIGAAPKQCCATHGWRGRMCEYHRGYETAQVDLLAALREAGRIAEGRYEQVGWAHPAFYDEGEGEVTHHPWMFDCARSKPGESVSWRPVYVLDGYDPGPCSEQSSGRSEVRTE